MNENDLGDKGKSKSKSRSKKDKCHYYHKLGHFKRDCLKIKKKNEKKVVSIAKENSNDFKTSC